jgi:hypothetical protein
VLRSKLNAPLRRFLDLASSLPLQFRDDLVRQTHFLAYSALFFFVFVARSSVRGGSFPFLCRTERWRRSKILHFYAHTILLDVLNPSSESNSTASAIDRKKAHAVARICSCTGTRDWDAELRNCEGARITRLLGFSRDVMRRRYFMYLQNLFD